MGSLVANLGLLSYFKYGGFLLDNFTLLLGQMGMDYQPPEMDIILPVGISFYTFQTLSYTLDIYFKKMKPWDSFLDYAMYVTFFPQLVAGPIVRAAEFLPQCYQERKATIRQFSWGVCLMIIGMFEKIVLADTVFAPIVDKVYFTAAGGDTLAAWTGTTAFAGQIFCDFAGYSTTAIGVAMMFGFALPDNFRFPYAAVGFSDFWHRWHISLSTWLRDYLYIPLGGNRKGRVRTYVNLMLTMLIGGLWHGAAWTFVIWGALHGAYLILERGAKHVFGHVTFWQKRFGRFVLGVMTFTAVTFAWSFFRATSFEQSKNIASSLFGFPVRGGVTGQAGEAITVAFVMGAIILTHMWLRNSTLEEKIQKIPGWLFGLILAAMMLAMYFNTGDERAFIYFQF